MSTYDMTTHKHNGYVDLRSDTVTQPTEAMRKAMYEAEIGDDVYGEDPTVNRVQEMSAQRLGKAAGLLVLSGTMGNLVSMLTHCGRGDEAIMGDRAHTFTSEQGGSSGMGGIHPRTVRNQPDGTLDLREVEAAIRPDNEHYPRTKLISVENTQNNVGGRVLPPTYMRELGALARKHNVKVHVDGARIFNAAVALGVDASVLAEDAEEPVHPHHPPRRRLHEADEQVVIHCEAVACVDVAAPVKETPPPEARFLRDQVPARHVPVAVFRQDPIPQHLVALVHGTPVAVYRVNLRIFVEEPRHERQRARGQHVVAVEIGHDVAGRSRQSALHRVGLENDECPFHGG